MNDWNKKPSGADHFNFSWCHFMCPARIQLTFETMVRLHPSSRYTFYIFLETNLISGHWSFNTSTLKTRLVSTILLGNRSPYIDSERTSELILILLVTYFNSQRPTRCYKGVSDALTWYKIALLVLDPIFSSRYSCTTTEWICERVAFIYNTPVLVVTLLSINYPFREHTKT